MDTHTTNTRPERLTVVGLGYLGATHAICMAALGHRVVGVDVDAEKVAALQHGVLPFVEPGLQELLDEVVAARRITFTTDFDSAAAFGDVQFVCVGTPQHEGTDAANLEYVEKAFDALATRATRTVLVVGKSTVPVGTAARLAARIAGRSTTASRWRGTPSSCGRASRSTTRCIRIGSCSAPPATGRCGA